MKYIYSLPLLFCFLTNLSAQEDDLLSLLEEEEQVNFVTAAFKTNRVVNLHSLENTAKGVLDIKISHRFGFINSGAYDFFGLDDATIRIGGDYGITDRLVAGFGRNSFEKTYDGYLKYKFFRQQTGKKNIPVTVAAFASTAIRTLRWENPDRDNYFSSRLFYTFQAIIGRKFSKSFSMQIVPSVVHRNLVETRAESNDVFAIGGGARLKLTNRLAINAEYIYVLPDQLAPQYQNSFSIGFDLETGGHVFQLHFTNSTSMVEKGFITETTGDWMNGDIHFGFNISRVFTVVKPKIE